MVKYKNWVFVVLILFFLLFSFSPTIFELFQSNNLTDKNREFILEHNYYWPDYNLYLSKIRQGFEGHLTAKELYTSESHRGSLIQEFYVVLGLLGRYLKLVPNYSYLLGRIIFAPLLLIVILKLVKYYFPSTSVRVRPLAPLRSDPIAWQIISFLIIIVSGSFPRFWFDQNGALQIGRYMEWWSNIDSLQRITFIPHILFGQVVSFFLLYQLVIRVRPLTPLRSDPVLIFYIILGNLVGLVFPPSLITLNGVILLLIFVKSYKSLVLIAGDVKEGIPNVASPALSPAERGDFEAKIGKLSRQDPQIIVYFLFIIFTLPSLLYIYLLTKQLPWSALLNFHRTHPMMIPLDQYVLGTGPIIFLGFFGAIISIIKKEEKYRPLILWLVVTFGLASFFSIVKEQSPLRFTQTGLFIPLGILGAYFLRRLSNLSYLRYLSYLSIIIYIFGNLFMMKVSFDWQVSWIGQLIAATYPAVPYPPQTVFPLKDWMAGIRWLRDNTKSDDVILAEITAGNYIPAYSGNTVYFGQANTYDYENKQILVDKFFKGEFNLNQAEIFIKNGRIKYVFEDKNLPAGETGLSGIYPFLKPVFHNSIVTIYKVKS